MFYYMQNLFCRLFSKKIRTVHKYCPDMCLFTFYPFYKTFCLKSIHSTNSMSHFPLREFHLVIIKTVLPILLYKGYILLDIFSHYAVFFCGENLYHLERQQWHLLQSLSSILLLAWIQSQVFQ